MAARGNPNWARGVSGNPGGRRRGTPLTDALWRVIKLDDESMEGDLPLPRGKTKVADRIARKMCNAAANGDTIAAKLVWERVEGRLRQEGELNVNLGFSQQYLAALRGANAASALPEPKGEIIDLKPEPVK